MHAGNTVSVIDTATGEVSGTVTVGHGPVGLAFTPDSKHAYVANSGDNTVSVIDTATGVVSATIPVGNVPDPGGDLPGVAHHPAET